MADDCRGKPRNRFLAKIATTVAVVYSIENLHAYLDHFASPVQVHCDALGFLLRWTSQQQQQQQGPKRPKVVDLLFREAKLRLAQWKHTHPNQYCHLQWLAVELHVEGPQWATFDQWSQAFDLAALLQHGAGRPALHRLLGLLKHTHPGRMQSFECIFELLFRFNLLADVPTLVLALTIFTLKCQSPGKKIGILFNKHKTKFTEAVYRSLLGALDEFMVQANLDRFTQMHEMQRCHKGQVKRFFNYMYNHPLFGPIDHRSTPRYIQNLNIGSVIYYWNEFSKSKSISEEAFMELSLILAQESSKVKDILLNSLLQSAPCYREEFIRRYQQPLIQPTGPFTGKWTRKQLLDLSSNPLSTFYIGDEQDNFEIVFVDDEGSFRHLLHDLKSLTEKTLGVDSEWRPVFSYREKAVSILQIAYRKYCAPGTSISCALVSLANFATRSQQYRGLWHELATDILANAQYTKIVFDFGWDTDMLRCTVGRQLTMVNMIDFGQYRTPLLLFLAEQPPFTTEGLDSWQPLLERARNPDQSCRGLAALPSLVFGQPMCKVEQQSDWNRRPLRPDQLIYAALDVYSLLHVYSTLQTMLTGSETLKRRFSFNTVQELLLFSRRRGESQRKPVTSSRKSGKKANKRKKKQSQTTATQSAGSAAKEALSLKVK